MAIQSFAPSTAQPQPKAPQPLSVKPQVPVAAPQPMTPQKPVSWAPGVNVTSTNPSNDLRGQTISPGPTADRGALAKSYLDTWNTQTQPYFQKDLNSATQNNFAMGRGGSGQLRTSLGDLTLNRDIQRNAAGQNFYNNALEGSIGDAYRNLGLAQQQQGFQAGQAGDAFSQAAQLLGLGYAGNPSGAYSSAANTAGANAASSNASLQSLIQQILANQGATTPTTSATPGVSQIPSTPVFNSGGIYG